MKPFETITFSEQDSVATVTLVDPHTSMKMIKELGSVCDHIEDSSSFSIIVFKGSESHFSLGLEFGDFQPEKGLNIHGFHKWEKICVRIERLPCITIAVLQGRVVGGGVQLALTCDFRLAASTTTLTLPEVHLGFLPGMAIFRVAKYIGLGRAKEWILGTSDLSAQKAMDWGLISAIDSNIESMLHNHIQSVQPVHPVTVQLARRLLNESFHDSFEDAIGHFLAAQQRAISHEQFLKTIERHQED